MSQPVVFVSGKKPAVAKWLFKIAVILLLLLLLIGVGLYLLVAPAGTVERFVYAVKGKAGIELVLPECRSKIVASEIYASFGSGLELVNRYSPVSLIELRRAREIGYDPIRKVRRCSGEYQSVGGKGSFEYTVQWYDPKSPTIDDLTVRIDRNKIGAPELLKLLSDEPPPTQPRRY